MAEVELLRRGGDGGNKKSEGGGQEARDEAAGKGEGEHWRHPRYRVLTCGIHTPVFTPFGMPLSAIVQRLRANSDRASLIMTTGTGGSQWATREPGPTHRGGCGGAGCGAIA